MLQHHAPKIWIVSKLAGELISSVSTTVAATPGGPLTLLDRLKLMGIEEAGGTRVKASDPTAKERSTFHVVSPLDRDARGLQICTTDAGIAQVLAARPATLAVHCSPRGVFFAMPSEKRPPLTPASIAASRTCLATRVYRARLGRRHLFPHVLEALARAETPVFIDGLGAMEEREEGGGEEERQRGAKKQPGSNLWVTVTTCLDSRPLRAMLAEKDITISNLLRVSQGPFTLKAGLTDGSALEVRVPPHLILTARKFAKSMAALAEKQEEGGGKAHIIGRGGDTRSGDDNDKQLPLSRELQ